MKILIIDDHPLIQEALKHVLAVLDSTLELVQAQDASDAHAALSREPDTDLILLDLALPDSDGFELLGDLRREWPGMPVLVLSATHDRSTVEHAAGVVIVHGAAQPQRKVPSTILTRQQR